MIAACNMGSCNRKRTLGKNQRNLNKEWTLVNNNVSNWFINCDKYVTFFNHTKKVSTVIIDIISIPYSNFTEDENEVQEG